MIDLEHCLILGEEPIDSNSINRCMFNLYDKMGQYNSNFLNATSDNVPQSPFFSGGYSNALTDISYVSSISNAVSATRSRFGLVPRLYCGNSNIVGSNGTDGFTTDSVTGAYTYSMEQLSTFAPTVDSLMRESSPLLFKSILDSETSLVTATSSIGCITSPTIKYTSYLITERNGISFGTVEFSRNNGDVQNNTISLNLKTDLIGIDGIGKIKFFTIGNGIASGVKSVSEDLDMVTDVGGCSVTYVSDYNVIISNITKNDNCDEIIIDKDTGRILDSDEEYDYTKCIKLDNDTVTLQFLVLFDMKSDVVKYSDDIWCFNIVPSKEYGQEYLYNSTGWADSYYRYSFDNFEAADDGKNLPDGSHLVWDEGCTTMASDAFNGCYNASFKSLCWISPRMRYADRMFKNCVHATFDNLPKDIVLNNLRSASEMFFNCKSARFGTLESLTMTGSTKIDRMFKSCNSATFDALKKITICGNANEMFYGDYRATFGELESISGNCSVFTSMFEGCDNAEFNKLNTITTSQTGASIIDASRMFCNLEKPKFDEIETIGITSDYNGTSMFEGCYNATFENLETLGSVKYGNSMFMNLDKFDEDEYVGKARFQKLDGFGASLVDGTDMFCNDRYLHLTVQPEYSPSSLVVGNSMFEQTSYVKFRKAGELGHLNRLVDAEYMFSNTMTAVVEGDMNSLLDGSNMFSHSHYVDVEGSLDSLVNMYSMCLSSDYVHFHEVPSSAIDMQASFACVSGNCIIDNWNYSNGDRLCIQTFENSNGVRINGNILDGELLDTSYMFNNTTGLVLNNPNMNGNPSDVTNKYFSTIKSSDFGMLQNFDSEDTALPHFTFVGSCTDNIDGLAAIVASSDVRNSLLCIESINSEEFKYNAYTTSKTPSSVGDMVKFFYDYCGNAMPMEFSRKTVSAFEVNDDGTRGDLYGTLTVSHTAEVYDIVFRNESTGESVFYGYTAPLTFTPSEEPYIVTFTDVDSTNLTERWKDATEMFHNVVQASLLSGYDCFTSNSLEVTRGMFALDERIENDRTFNNAGRLFRKLGRSNVHDMSSMFQNRNISNINVFTDPYSTERVNNKSFMIPYKVNDASYAFNNCSIDQPVNINYIYLSIPDTLVNGNHMFDGYSGPPIRLDYDNGNTLYFNDGLESEMMFRGCRFYDEMAFRYRISSPNAYLQVFNESDFNPNRVVSLEFRDGKNFAYPYSREDFFNNDLKVLGCSSMTFQNLETDISEWINSYSTTTRNAMSVEGAYFSTIIAPKNYTSDSGEYFNYEIMEANRTEDYWNIGMSKRNMFTNSMISDISKCSNSVLMDGISSISNSENRLTCMFSPDVMFGFSDTYLGDQLWRITEDSLYLNIYERLSQYKNLSYSGITLNGTKYIDAKEMPLAFFGLSSATFENLTNIGNNIVAGYGAFAYCDSATFNSLSAIEVMQYDSEDTFTSRFISDRSQNSNWYGNYNDMFCGDGNATFKNLDHITFNTINGTDENGNNARMWLDDKMSLFYSFVDDDGDVVSYNVKITQADELGKKVYVISVYDYSGNGYDSGDGSKYGLRFVTDVEVHEHVEMSYELVNIDGTVSIVITILDKSNNLNYFVANKYKIDTYASSPYDAYASFDYEEDFSVAPFLSSGLGYTTSFKSVDGRIYSVSTHSEREEGSEEEKLSFDIRDNDSGRLITFGTSFPSVSAEDKSRTWYSRLCYEKDGATYIAITMFMLQQNEQPSYPIEYPADALCYRIYAAEGNLFVDQVSVIPGTIRKYDSMLKMVESESSLMSHKAYCSGMFKDCKKASFNSLNSINIPMTGSCAEMFSGCTNMKLEERQLQSLVLPISETYGDDDDYKKYYGMFKDVSTDNVSFDALTINNTNIYKIGLPVRKLDDGSNHAVIGEHLFDGMIAPKERGRFDLYGKYGTEPKPCTYQDAVYYLKLDSTVAEKLFDKVETFTVKYHDIAGYMFKKIEVEKPKEGGSYNKAFIPKYPDEEVTITEWSFWDALSGIELYRKPSTATSSEPVTGDLNVYAVYQKKSNLSVVAHRNSDSETLSSINARWKDDEEVIHISEIHTSE